MQGLIIAARIIGVLAISLTVYTAVICHHVNKIGKERERQTAFCHQHYKKILILLIVNVTVCAGGWGGYTALTIIDAELSDIIFPLISCFASVFSIVALSALIIIAKKKTGVASNEFTCDSSTETLQHFSYVGMETKLLGAQETNHMIELKNSLDYFKKNGHAIIEKYAYTVENLIDKLTNICSNLFLQMFDQDNMLTSDLLKNPYIPMSNILIYPYKSSDSPFLKNAIRRDGLEFDQQSINAVLNTQLQKIVALYVEKLKEEIQSNSEWDDESTLSLLIYTIIRNNVIKYYHDSYVSQYGYENLEELCHNVSEPVGEEEIFTYSMGIRKSTKILVANKIAAVWFIYYYIYENDVNLPFVETYKKLCLEMKSIIANQEAERLKNELFGSHKAEVKISEKETRYLSPIEKVDNMTGEEFELFMTQYFAEHGFKATHTPLSGDYGIDLILENDFVKIGVQAKCYSNKVTLSAIQEVVAGLRHYGLSSGMVVTNNYFQPSAIQLAKENNITLWDRNKLIEKLKG